MTTLREAAERALRVLELVSQATTEQFGEPLEVVDALRAALADPVQECPHGVTDGNCKECYEQSTAPPKRKPLTEEEILSLFRTSGSPTAFARAIERAHGIGEQP